MLVYHHSQSKKICILFGHGLVGSAISRKLQTFASLVQDLPTDWKAVDATITQIKTINLEQAATIEVIWAAGKAGFGAIENEVELEFGFYSQVIEALKAHCDRSSASIPRMWLMSSAGGLFEGQTHVSHSSQVLPLRPYSKLKLRQENLAVALFGMNHCVICRISSVYTTTNLSGRLGLIPVLVKNGIQNKISTIIGNESTLRDYVLDNDIGTFVFDHLDTTVSGIQYLIDGKPMSIQFIKNSIEEIILKKLFLRYLVQKTNSENISFLSNLRSPGFKPSPMLSNVRMLYYRILSSTNT